MYRLNRYLKKNFAALAAMLSLLAATLLLTACSDYAQSKYAGYIQLEDAVLRTGQSV